MLYLNNNIETDITHILSQEIQRLPFKLVFSQRFKGIPNYYRQNERRERSYYAINE